MNSSNLDMWWGSPASARAYRSDALSIADEKRVAARTAPKPKLDWEVSRALMQSAGVPAGGQQHEESTLSHSASHAIYIVARNVESVGVDLEPLLPRDVMSLAPWCCTDEERSLLEEAPEQRRSELFYILWTIKESFVKAANLDFPADMRSNGLARRDVTDAATDDSLSHYQLITSLQGRWHAASYCLDGKWMTSVVWRSKPGATSEQITWHPGPHTVLPSISRRGRWSAG
jgi:4'-phosphopantetheinyl transferase